MFQFVAATLIVLTFAAMGYRVIRSDRVTKTPTNSSAPGSIVDVKRVGKHDIIFPETSIEADKAELLRSLTSTTESAKERSRAILRFQTKHMNASGTRVLIGVYPQVTTSEERHMVALAVSMTDDKEEIQTLITDAAIPDSDKASLRDLVREFLEVSR